MHVNGKLLEKRVKSSQGFRYPVRSQLIMEKLFLLIKLFKKHVCECCRISLAWTADGPVVFWRNIFNTNTRDFAISRLDTGEIRRVTDDEWQVDSCPHHGGDMAVGNEDQLHLVWFTNGKTRQGLFYKNITGKNESSPLAIGNLKHEQVIHLYLHLATRSLLPGVNLLRATFLHK